MRGRLRSPCEDSARIMYVATLAQSSNREGIVSYRRYACAVVREKTRRLRGLHRRGRLLNLASCRRGLAFFRTEGLSSALQTSTAQLAEPPEPRTDRHVGSRCWFVDTTSLTGLFRGQLLEQDPCSARNGPLCGRGLPFRIHRCSNLLTSKHFSCIAAGGRTFCIISIKLLAAKSAPIPPWKQRHRSIFRNC